MSVSPLAKYVAEKRCEAARQGRPILRLAGPAVELPHIAGRLSSDNNGPLLLFVSYRGRTPELTPVDRQFTQLGWNAQFGIHELEQLCIGTESDPSSWPVAFVVPDRQTGFRFLGDVAKVSTKLSRAIEVSRSAYSSSRFVVLTEALSRKFYAPEDMDVNSIQRWARILRVPLGVRGMIQMAQLVYGGAQHAQARVAANDESRVWAALARDRRSVSNECYCFSAMDKVTQSWRFIESVDALAREESRCVGVVFDVQVLSVWLTDSMNRRRPPALNVRLAVDGSYATKEGKELLVLSPETAAVDGAVLGEITSITVEQDVTVMTLIGPYAPAKKRERTNPLVSAATLDETVGTRYTVIERPFMPGFTGAAGSRWAGGSRPRVERPDVPTWLAIAGAPRIAA